MKKTIRRIVLAIVALIILVIGGGWLMIDSLAKSGIQKGGQYALGTPTDVKDVKLSLLNGSLMIDQLKVANPQGFASPHLMSTGKFSLEVRPSSVVGSPVQVATFVLDGLDINIEQIGVKNNISEILAHVKQLGGDSGGKTDGGGQKTAPADKGPGKKIRVDKLEIRNVVAHVYLPGGGAPLTVKVPAIEMKNVSSDGPDGVTIATLIARVFPAVMAAVMEKGKGIIPGDLKNVLNQDLASTADAMGGRATKMLQQATIDPAGLLKGSAAEDLNKSVGEPLKGLFDTPKPKTGEPKK